VIEAMHANCHSSGMELAELPGVKKMWRANATSDYEEACTQVARQQQRQSDVDVRAVAVVERQVYSGLFLTAPRRDVVKHLLELING
jgi:hypothetical protein